MNDNDNRSSYVVIPATAPGAYWEGYARTHTTVSVLTPTGERDAAIVLETVRGGSDGRSDATYLVDRLASGLHFASAHADLDEARDYAHRMADRVSHRVTR